ncbi:sulfite exporter TauE/SafE family protein, partial [Sphingomonas sp.]|uniref:sulfite exporter TauE/SafE family protein n=1 Tax=Sphingomonas sp. TaxID=28214 RepID=UPI002DBE8194
MIEPLYSIAGVLVGLLVGMTGVGGGSLMTPILVLVFGFHPVTAVGTDLLYASATKLAGTGVHGWRGTVDWRVVRRLATGSVPATLLTLAALSIARMRAEDTGRV